ncbi:unnamed protein product [Hydatigera taeniaeformis]|uniref:EF-hand domain-containing protein n=1 Tax=Hydatigena taeniaeformis TaxID=6205 RepID=A0A0R3WJ33_HYDTA|nr:unnamed protein product [Hydatigera taeniaeformis]
MIRRKSLFTGQKSLTAPRLDATATFTVYTRDRRMKYVVPSVFASQSFNQFRNRRLLDVSTFVKKVTEKINSKAAKIPDSNSNFPAAIRLVIISLVCELKRHPKMHFDGREIAIILQMYYAIVGYKVRLMTQIEFVDFLVGSLGITNSHTLAGIKRVTVQLRDDRRRPEKLGIPPGNFVIMLSIYLRGSLLERAELAFEIMDIDRDGLLRKQVEFRRFLAGSFDPEIAATHADIDPDQPVRETIQYLENLLASSSDRGVDLIRFKEMVVKQPWIIDCLLPISCRELHSMAFQNLLTVKTL